mmetsp:Transcript_51890/g.117063  ORF Transcript_51890/g.117063 Transcript_51890/m.117063 type:complete len:424 (-) Transcript_51890:100-1371(-)
MVEVHHCASPMERQRMLEARHVQLDVFRILGVCGVILAHGNDQYLTYNMVLGQNWGLQIMCLICGICWSMSNRPALEYSFRLFLYFLVGTFCNWLAWVYTGAAWQHDLWNVVYQMWFALAVAFGVLFTAPLKTGLTRRGRWLWLAPGIYLALTALAAAMYHYGLWVSFFPRLGLGGGLQYYSPYADDLGFYFIWMWLVLFLVSLSLAVLLRGHLPNGDRHAARKEPKALLFIVWGQLLLMYALSVAVAKPLGAWMHNVQIFIAGMVCQRFSMFGQREIAVAISSYWPLLIVFSVGALSVPYLHGRKDMWPDPDFIIRSRFTMVEAIFVVSFLCCSTPAKPLGDRAPVQICHDPHNVLGWLGRWALLAYLAHEGLLRTIPRPVNYFCVYGSALFFWIEETRRLRKRRLDSKVECPEDVYMPLGA